MASIPPKLRARHCYIAGASGTGKSMLLLNMILQDIESGQGVGLLDPHGDLVRDVLCRIPEDRLDDVILFDPADEDYPFALNILEAKDEAERERIANETVMSLEKYFPNRGLAGVLEQLDDVTASLLSAAEKMRSAIHRFRGVDMSPHDSGIIKRP